MELKLQNICKSYGDQTVLRDVCCTIPAGSICAVTAPSGSGKTTLLRLILGLEKPDSGVITGVPPRKSAVFQEDRLCPGLTVLGNIRTAVGRTDRAAVLALLEQLNLADAAEKKAEELSGGMARRAALARALLAPGELLVLDEPFTGLDDENRLAAAEAIQSHRNGRTVLFVTHRQEDLELLRADLRITLE